MFHDSSLKSAGITAVLVSSTFILSACGGGDSGETGSNISTSDVPSLTLTGDNMADVLGKSVVLTATTSGTADMLLAALPMLQTSAEWKPDWCGSHYEYQDGFEPSVTVTTNKGVDNEWADEDTITISLDYCRIADFKNDDPLSGAITMKVNSITVNNGDLQQLSGKVTFSSLKGQPYSDDGDSYSAVSFGGNYTLNYRKQNDNSTISVSMKDSEYYGYNYVTIKDFAMEKNISNNNNEYTVDIDGQLSYDWGKSKAYIQTPTPLKGQLNKSPFDGVYKIEAANSTYVSLDIYEEDKAVADLHNMDYDQGGPAWSVSSTLSPAIWGSPSRY